MEGGTLRECFPQIYAITQHKDIKICDSLVENSNGEKEQQILALRNLNDWDSGKYAELLGMLPCISLDGSIDAPQWCLSFNGSFSVKSF